MCLLLFDVSIEATFIVAQLIAAQDLHQVDVARMMWLMM